MDGHNIILKQSYKQYEQLFNQGYTKHCHSDNHAVFLLTTIAKLEIN